MLVNEPEGYIVIKREFFHIFISNMVLSFKFVLEGSFPKFSLTLMLHLSVAHGHIPSLHLQHVPDVPMQQLQPSHLLIVQLSSEVDAEVGLFQGHVQGVAASEWNQCILIT